jgi:hypothetical protein
VILFPVCGATYCRFPRPGGFLKNEKSLIIENGESSTGKLYRTPIANRGRPFEWSSYFRFAATPSGGFRFRSVLTTTKIANNSRSVAAGREMYTEHQYQTRVGLSNGQVTSATRRHLAAVSASGLYKNRGLLENGGNWTKNVYRTPIANRGRSIEWSSYFCYASTPSGGFRFRSVSTTKKIANYSRMVEAG